MAISWYNVRKECTKGEVQSKIVPLTKHCAIRYMLPGDCHGPKGPRNDAVVVGWHITVTTANNHFPFHLLCAKRPC